MGLAMRPGLRSNGSVPLRRTAGVAVVGYEPLPAAVCLCPVCARDTPGRDAPEDARRPVIVEEGPPVDRASVVV